MRMNHTNFQQYMKVLKRVVDKQRFKLFLLQSDNQQRSFLHYACEKSFDKHLNIYLQLIDDIMFYDEKRELHRRKSNDGKIALMLAAEKFLRSGIHTYWNFFEQNLSDNEMKTMFRLKDSSNKTALHYANKSVNKRNFDFLKNKYENILGLEETQKIISNEN